MDIIEWIDKELTKSKVLEALKSDELFYPIISTTLNGKRYQYGALPRDEFCIRYGKDIIYRGKNIENSIEYYKEYYQKHNKQKKLPFKD